MALRMLRPLGKLEQVSAACHRLGFFYNVGVSATYRLPAASPPTDLRRLVYAAVATVLHLHPVLFAVPEHADAPDAYFATLPSIDLRETVSFVQADGADHASLDRVLQIQHNTAFAAGAACWRLVVLHAPAAPAAFTAAFIYHHALGDGVSGLVFHRSLQQALNAAMTTRTAAVTVNKVLCPPGLVLLPPLEGLHPLPIDPQPPMPPSQSGDDLAWTAPITTPCHSLWQSFVLSPAAAHAFFHACRRHQRSVTSVLAAVAAASLFDQLPSSVTTLACIVPISLRPWLHGGKDGQLDDAMGTYFDATKAYFSRDSTDIWTAAQTAAQALAAYRRNTSPTGEPYTTVAALQGVSNVAALFQAALGHPREAALEVTNIGRFSVVDGPTLHWAVGPVLLSRSAAASGAAMTISAATGGDGSLAVGFSWQEGALAAEVAAGLIKGVRAYFGE